uniref:Uncharacterized protein LOC114328572 isoform X2 n=1 Tax=Diabrotica virgifera virgifera TaxID=50390 RepID=A0A6P7FJ85_DIAVI
MGKSQPRFGSYTIRRKKKMKKYIHKAYEGGTTTSHYFLNFRLSKRGRHFSTSTPDGATAIPGEEGTLEGSKKKGNDNKLVKVITL